MSYLVSNVALAMTIGLWPFKLADMGNLILSNTIFVWVNGEIKYLQNLVSAKISTINPIHTGFFGTS